LNFRVTFTVNQNLEDAINAAPLHVLTSNIPPTIHHLHLASQLFWVSAHRLPTTKVKSLLPVDEINYLTEEINAILEMDNKSGILKNIFETMPFV